MTMTPSSTQPERRRFVQIPNVKVSAAGSTAIARSPKKLLNGVGFAYGCAPLALKKPPPLVPKFLINSSAATGPCAIDWSWPSSVRACV